MIRRRSVAVAGLPEARIAISNDMSACVSVSKTPGLARWHVPSAFFVTDPLGYRKLKLGEPIGLLAATEREAISNGDDQPAY
jgi:hypothetical protein